MICRVLCGPLYWLVLVIIKNAIPWCASSWSSPAEFKAPSQVTHLHFYLFRLLCFSTVVLYLMFTGYGKKPKHMRSKTWDAGNGRVSPPSPPGTNGKKLAASYAPKKDRESFRRALVSIIR